MDTFLGRDVEYWIELQKRAENLNVVNLIKDLSDARFKIQYYENMIDRMHAYRKLTNEK